MLWILEYFNMLLQIAFPWNKFIISCRCTRHHLRNISTCPQGAFQNITKSSSAAGHTRHQLGNMIVPKISFKACVHYFLSNFYFYQMIALQKLWEMFFISSKKLCSFLRYSNFCNFSLPFHTFQIQKDKCKWNNLWCHELACINLQM